MRFCVLGGAGAMGSIVVRDLIETAPADAEIVIADFNLETAKAHAEGYKSSRVSAVKADVRDPASLKAVLEGCTVAVNSVQYHHNVAVMKAALAAGSHYTDLGGLFHVTRKQLELHDEFLRNGLTAVIGMGAAPGITNILARYAAESMERVREIHLRVAGVDNTRYSFQQALPVSYSIKTILEEFSQQPAVYTKGKFKFVEPMSGQIPHRFPAPVGVQKPMFTLHSEVATLPLSYADRGVREVTFKIAFSQDFLEKVKFLRDTGLASADPIRLGDQSVVPIDLVNAVIMSQEKPRQVGRLKQYEIVRAVVKGERKKKKITHIVDCHTAGMPRWGIGLDIDTGSPPSIAAQMIARGEIEMRGVLAPEVAVDPAKFFKHLKVRKMEIHEQVKSGWDLKL